jgi:hypothetical protein
MAAAARLPGAAAGRCGALDDEGGAQARKGLLGCVRDLPWGRVARLGAERFCAARGVSLHSLR